MTATVLPDTFDIEQIVAEVFGSFLGEDGLPELAPPFDDHLPVTASVSITGGWEGHVVLGCTDDGARAAAAVLLAMDQADIVEADIADAIGELVNMVGGNIKSLLPGPSALTLPLVSLGGGALHHPSSREAVRLDLVWKGEAIRVSVWAATSQEGSPL
jgi:chemotaxis protein CheX